MEERIKYIHTDIYKKKQPFFVLRAIHYMKPSLSLGKASIPV